MSTRSTIFTLDLRPDWGIHVYDEMVDGRLWVAIGKGSYPPCAFPILPTFIWGKFKKSSRRRAK